MGAIIRKIFLFSRKATPKPCRAASKYLFARALFKSVRPGISIGVIAGREQVYRYIRGEWWNNEPVTAARNIHIMWGGIQK